MAFSQADEVLARQLLETGRLQAAQLDQLRSLAESRGCGLREVLAISDERTMQAEAEGDDSVTLFDPAASARLAQESAGQDGIATIVSSAGQASPTASGSGELHAAETYMSFDQSSDPVFVSSLGSTKSSTSGRARSSESARLGAAAPTAIGPYEILGTLGQGGMGVVYKARHTGLDRLVALKVLIPNRVVSVRALERFLQEARTAASLDTHPNIVSVLDSGSADGVSYMAMELVEGTTLDVLIKAEKAKPRAAARVLAEIADALEFAHQRGVIHRDIKPSNIMISRKSEAKLNDFGVAKVLQEEQGQTRTGAMIGTVQFMSPEQAEDSKSIDHRSDIYSLGAVLYTVLAGRPPYVGTTAANILSSMIRSDAPPPSTLKEGVDPDLEAICLKALAKNPGDRFQTAGAMRDALNAYRAGDAEQLAAITPRGRRPAWLAPLLIGGAALLALSSALAFSGDGPPPRYRLAGLKPASGQALKEGRFELQGRLDPAPAKVAVGQVEVRVEADGRFAIPLILEEGAQSVRLEALTEEGASPVKVAEPRFIIDLSPPSLSLDPPLPERVVLPELSLEGRCSDPVIPGLGAEDKAGPLSLRINGRPVLLLAEGRFKETVSLEPGANAISYRLADGAGHIVEGQWSVTCEPPKPAPSAKPPVVLTPPEAKPAPPKLAAKPVAELILEGFYCPDGRLLKSPDTRLFLRCRRAPKRVLLKHNGRIQDLPLEEGALEIALPITLEEGDNRLEAEVFREGGASERASLLLLLDSTPPKLALSIDEDFDLVGAVTDRDLVSLSLDGEALELTEAAKLEVALGRERARAGVLVVARDRAGNTAQQRYRRATVALIKDLDLWVEASHEAQDAEIAIIAEALAEDFAFVETNDYECGKRSYRLASFRHRSSALLLHLIPGGEAEVGLRRGAVALELRSAKKFSENTEFYSAAQLKELLLRECSRKTVRLKPFLIGVDEVTEGAWDRVEGRGGRSRRAKDGVSWSAAAKWVERAGGGLRLPSESEWEYACRAGSDKRYFWGSSSRSLKRYVAWGEDIDFDEIEPNAFGLLNTLGGLWEWCEDDFEDSLGRLPRDGTPLRNPRARSHVRKGGGFRDAPFWLRCSARDEGLWSEPEERRQEPPGGRPPRGPKGRPPPRPGMPPPPLRPPPRNSPRPKSAETLGLRVACSLPDNL